MPRKSSKVTVEVRASSIRLIYRAGGERKIVVLKMDGQTMAPTNPNVQYAKRLASDMEAEMRRGIFRAETFFPDSDNAGNRQRFQAVAADWLDSKGQLEKATLAQYRSGINKWVSLFPTDVLMVDVTYQLIARVVGKTDWPSAKSANNNLIVLRGIMGYYYAGPKAGENPMIGIANLKVVKMPPDPLTAAERDRVLARLQEQYDPRVYAYFLFAFYTGMRPEEMIALEWGDLDAAKNLIRVQRVRTFKGSERDGSKTHTVRDVYLVEEARRALAIMKPYTFLKSLGAERVSRIFESPVTNAPWHDERSQRDTFWAPTLKALGIRSRRAYCTRHTYATVALMAGINPARIAAQLGHANTKMLFEVYARWIDSPENNLADKMMEAAFSVQTPRLLDGTKGE